MSKIDVKSFFRSSFFFVNNFHLEYEFIGIDRRITGITAASYGKEHDHGNREFQTYKKFI